jgi:hypothetical protein
LKIIEKSITEITPYEKNPRKNGEAVEYVANSIKQSPSNNEANTIDRKYAKNEQ